jgi:hypothetical protein
LLQSQREQVAFFMHGLSVLVRFTGFKRHWHLAQRAANETGFT